MSEEDPRLLNPDFNPPQNFLDERFVNNTGGDMSNMVSRGIFELVEAEDPAEPSLDVEIYHKDNETTGVRELHGNLVMYATLNDGDDVEMGFLFSPEKDGSFDGLEVELDSAYSSADGYTPVFVAQDLW